MNTRHWMNIPLLIVFLLLVGIITSSCESGGGGSENLGINQTGSETVGSRLEEIRVNNCSGKETLTTTLEKKLEVSVEGGFGIEIKQVGEASLRTKYAREESSSIVLPAAPGTDMLFTVEWTDEAFFGEITIDGQGGPSYEVHVSTPHESGAFDQGCISGSYHLVRWDEAPSPYTIYMDVDSGTLDINSSGDATWFLFIRERGENPFPTPSITCMGRFYASSQMLEGVPGGNAGDWTFDMSGFNHDLWMTFCGWDVGGETDPFTLYPRDLGAGNRVLEMKNSRGTLIWEK